MSGGSAEAAESSSERVQQILRWLRPWEIPALVTGVVATILQHGIPRSEVSPELAVLTVTALLLRITGLSLQGLAARDRTAFLRQNTRAVALGSLWFGGALLLLLFGPVIPVWYRDGRLVAVVAWSELFVLLVAVIRGLGFVSRISQSRDPAVIFVLTFVGLIGIGTLLLMLPGAQTAIGTRADFLDQFRYALFTSTSASCVTGLAVVPTGGSVAHWSRFGHVVIMGLIQVGGLGIMSLGAVFALLAGRSLAMRESAAVSEVTEIVSPAEVRRLLASVLGFTLVCEGAGAVLLSTLWPELPLGERLFYGVFHSVSAFCNAGFTLTENSYVGYGTCWQVWGVTAGLIICGGLGFGTISAIGKAVRDHLRDWHKASALFRRRRFLDRMNLGPRLVFSTTALLLIGGAVGYWLLEAGGVHGKDSFGERLAEAWFQSVTFRTAGFNTVDHAELLAGTKLFGIGLMTIGASPGSTGGGIKTVAFAVMVLSLRSILRGRRSVECDGRTIPDSQVRQAFAIIALGLTCIMTATLVLVLFENNEGQFLNHMFEAASAFATVGVSAGMTPGLSPASHFVLIITMFLGRVGPLTVMMALASQTSSGTYQYPEERVTLG